VQSQWLTFAQRNHNSIMFKAIEPGDPVAKAMMEFVARNNSIEEANSGHGR
jgi:hypothetical protein